MLVRLLLTDIHTAPLMLLYIFQEQIVCVDTPILRNVNFDLKEVLIKLTVVILVIHRQNSLYIHFTGTPFY